LDGLSADVIAMKARKTWFLQDLTRMERNAGEADSVRKHSREQRPPQRQAHCILYIGFFSLHVPDVF